MRCPKCKSINNDKVINVYVRVRTQDQKRRRVCMKCGHRWNTIERIVEEKIESKPINQELICPDCGEKLVKMSSELDDGSGWMHGYLCGCKEKTKEDIQAPA